MSNASEQKLAEIIQEALLSEEFGDVNDVITFNEAGVMTGNTGLVVTMPGGEKFQVSIIYAGRR